MITLPQHSLIALLKQLGVAAFYALLHYIGARYFEGENIVGYFEPASGLALAALLIGGKRYVLGLLLGAVLIHTTTGDSIWEAVTIASGDTLQALCGAWLLTRDGKFDLRLQSLRDYLRLILLGGCASIAIGALAVNTTLLVSGLLAPANYFHSLIQWWMSDSLGVILIAPLIMLWREPENNRREAGQMAEAALILGLTILAGQAVFLGWWPDNIGIEAKGYWMFLVVTWVAVRIGSCGTTVVLAMTAIYALLGAIHGVGYFADDIAQTHLLNYWLYMLTLSVVGMALATHFTERKQFETKLRNRTDELALHNQVLQQISLGIPLPKVLDELARQVEALHRGMLCSILLVDEGGKHLRHGAAPSLPDYYNQAINGLVIGDGMGACGTAAFRGERVIVEDVQQHAYWPEPYRDLARQAGVQSCWSQPIKDGNKRVLGTFAIYRQKPAQPSETEIALIERFAGFTALVMDRVRIQDDLRASEERFRQLAENIREVFWMTDPAKGKMLYISPAYEQVWGRTLQSLYDSPRAWLEAIHGEDRQRVLQAALTKQAAGLYDEEYRIVRLNGEVRWIHDRAFPVRDSGGVVYRIAGVAEDITERRLAENETKEAQERFEMIFNATPDAAVISRLQDGCITNVNDAFTELSGYPMGEAIGSSTIGLNLWANHGDREKFINELRTKGVCKNLEAQFQSKNGKQHTGLLSAKITLLQGIQHIISITRDITERKRMEQNLRDSEARFRAVAQTANDAIITANAAGNIVDCNIAAELFFGYTKAEINGQPLTVLMPERFRNLHNEGLARMTDGGAPRIIGKFVEVAGLRKDGSEFPLELSLAQWQTADGQFFTAIIRDITERKAAEEQIHTLAFYDALTQLPNRRLLNDRLGQTMAASKRSCHYGALMFLDLDNFKPLNDTHGHGVGDLLLIEVAHRLTSCVREVDTVARFGGDEFVVLLGELDADQAEATAQARIVAEKIRSALAEPYLLKIQQEGKAETTVEHHCAASIGAVVFNSEAGIEDILKWADAAMYQAKERGRDQVYFFDSKS